MQFAGFLTRNGKLMPIWKSHPCSWEGMRFSDCYRGRRHSPWSFILMLLNSRIQRLVVPIMDYKPYVDYRQILFGRRFPVSEDTASEEVSPEMRQVAG